MSYRNPPVLADPAVIVAKDGTIFVCWVEAVADQHRWIFASTGRHRHIGPLYGGEDSLEQIRRLVDTWCQMKRNFGNQTFTKEL